MLIFADMQEFSFDILFTGVGAFYLVVLTLLEIVLGIDNIIFISIVTDKLAKENQRKARVLGLSLALIIRLVLLALVSWIMSMDKEPVFTLFDKGFTVHDLILLAGGLFLIYKATKEMHSSVKGTHDEAEKKQSTKVGAVITQIVLIDIVFSFDSIITAIGMTNDISSKAPKLPNGHEQSALVIIYLAVIISMGVMLLFAKPISNFINNRPTIKMIALGFLVTIGVILIAEGFGEHIPKGYIYFAMAYALIMEFLNIRMRKNQGESER
jgi:predicted tellurium resistance membrane protein TerC